MAGVTLPGVAHAIPDRIRRLVFVSCAVPSDGTSLGEILEGFSPSAAVIAEGLGEGLVTSDGVLHPDLARVMFCNDMDEAEVASTLARMVPECIAIMSEPADLTGLRHPIPRTYVRLTRDAIVSLDTQNRMIENLGGAEVVDLDSGHMAMISRPADLAGVLNQL